VATGRVRFGEGSSAGSAKGAADAAEEGCFLRFKIPGCGGETSAAAGTADTRVDDIDVGMAMPALIGGRVTPRGPVAAAVEAKGGLNRKSCGRGLNNAPGSCNGEVMGYAPAPPPRDNCPVGVSSIRAPAAPNTIDEAN
jgi:hypothetical protein